MRKVIICSHLRPVDPLQELLTEYPQLSFEFCEEYKNLQNYMGEAEILITAFCNPVVLDAAPNLKWIQALVAGVDTYPLEKIKQREIILTNGKGIHRIHMAEYIIWAMITMARNLHVCMRNQQDKKWDRHQVQGEISGATIGILGLGDIGQETATRAKAMGMYVIGLKKNKADINNVDEIYSYQEMAEVFKKSDYIINLLPYTPQTDRIVNREYFDLMKPGACYVNVGRGKTVNEEDLIEALEKKKIRAMVSDVFYQEPLDRENPLWELDNVVITPHICGDNTKYLQKAADIIRHNLDVYLTGQGKMRNVINLDAGY